MSNCLKQFLNKPQCVNWQNLQRITFHFSKEEARGSSSDQTHSPTREESPPIQIILSQFQNLKLHLEPFMTFYLKNHHPKVLNLQVYLPVTMKRSPFIKAIEVLQDLRNPASLDELVQIDIVMHYLLIKKRFEINLHHLKRVTSNLSTLSLADMKCVFKLLSSQQHREEFIALNMFKLDTDSLMDDFLISQFVKLTLGKLLE